MSEKDTVHSTPEPPQGLDESRCVNPPPLVRANLCSRRNTPQVRDLTPGISALFKVIYLEGENQGIQSSYGMKRLQFPLEIYITRWN